MEDIIFDIKIKTKSTNKRSRRYNSSQAWRSWIDIVLATEQDIIEYTLAAMYIE